jgi:DNA-binding IclR family transcriptional regulator
VKATTFIGHRAANRIVDILELVSASRDGLALHEVSAQLEAPKSSLLPLLRALTARGYLAQGRDGGLSHGAAHLRAGQRRLGPARSGRGGPARADGADARTGETVFLGTLGRRRAVRRLHRQGRERADHPYAAGVGDRRPLHATSSGKAILAFLPREQREKILQELPLQRPHERTVTSPAHADRRAGGDQRTGVCVSLDEMVRGAAGVAAPIFDRLSQVAGVCTVAGPTDRVRPQASG